MIREKKIVLITRIVIFAIIAFGATFNLVANGTSYWWSSLLAAALFALLFFACQKVKTYDYDGKKIVVYSGFFNHYLKVDGEKYDERKCFSSFVPIYLSCEVDDLFIETTISTWNFITTKVNGKMQYPERFFKKDI